MLPAYIREEIVQRLFLNGFRDYQGLAQWVGGQGYEISNESLWRHGRTVDKRVPETNIALGSSSIAGCDGPFAASIQPALFRASPRIAADLLVAERAMPVANSDQRPRRLPCAGRASTQIDADLRT